MEMNSDFPPLGCDDYPPLGHRPGPRRRGGRGGSTPQGWGSPLGRSRGVRQEGEDQWFALQTVCNMSEELMLQCGMGLPGKGCILCFTHRSLRHQTHDRVCLACNRPDLFGNYFRVRLALPPMADAPVLPAHPHPPRQQQQQEQQSQQQKQQLQQQVQQQLQLRSAHDRDGRPGSISGAAGIGTALFTFRNKVFALLCKESPIPTNELITRYRAANLGALQGDLENHACNHSMTLPMHDVSGPSQKCKRFCFFTSCEPLAGEFPDALRLGFSNLSSLLRAIPEVCTVTDVVSGPTVKQFVKLADKWQHILMSLERKREEICDAGQQVT
eukprot:scaffold23791_cov21-Tisochrysis_lutea.AAC.1